MVRLVEASAGCGSEERLDSSKLKALFRTRMSEFQTTVAVRYGKEETCFVPVRLFSSNFAQLPVMDAGRFHLNGGMTDAEVFFQQVQCFMQYFLAVRRVVD